MEKFIRKHGMIEKGDVVIAGVSGGADSVCLLFMLCALREKLGFDVRVCHVNHGMRGEEADKDEEYVRQLCKNMDVPCCFFHEDVELIARKRKQSPEEAGRLVRREAFETMCRENGGTKIATAHHRDDNAETVLWNMARGTGLKGLGGIRPVSGKWIRPLLALTRAQTEGYLKENGILWCEDVTNQEDDYTRNRIRHHVLPALETQVNEGTVRHLGELSRQAQEVWDYLEQGVSRAWKQCVRIEPDADRDTAVGEKSVRGLLIEKDGFENELPAVRKQLIKRCIAFVCGRERDIEAVHVSAVAELFGKQTGRVLDLPGGIRAERTYTGVTLREKAPGRELRKTRETGGGFETALKIPGEVWIPGAGRRISCRFVDNIHISKAKEMPQKSYTKWFDYDIIKYSLSARTRQSGDYLIVDEKGSRQKLKSYFINEKIPWEEREKMLLIADGEHIIWIPGHRMSREYQISGATKKILEIKITEEKENGRDDQSAGSGRESR